MQIVPVKKEELEIKFKKKKKNEKGKKSTKEAESDTDEEEDLHGGDRHPARSISSWVPFYWLFCAEDWIYQIDACVACGSSGDWNLMVFCADCGEAYHCFCLFDSLLVNAERRSPVWRCPNCSVCEECGTVSAGDAVRLLVCDTCDRGYHMSCLKMAQAPSRAYRCNKCVRCRSCGSTTPGSDPRDKWRRGYTLCTPCGKLWSSGQHCPVCKEVWHEKDTAKMLACSGCKKRVHYQCDSMIEKKLNLYLTKKRQYYCVKCQAREEKRQQQLLKREDKKKKLMDEDKKFKLNRLSSTLPMKLQFPDFASATPELLMKNIRNLCKQIGRAVQQECRDRSRMPSSA
eukprot:TRINITY_DN15551_c0_g1_i4.p1 TRINITY_DN15551_c0_g1~~TRINITY_DN15551_c0_g1_i4.p1  ORF type:complete len:343 (+),score=34.54 TRINITY_DN15551_c0_g1_i4:367-1395(+)